MVADSPLIADLRSDTVTHPSAAMYEAMVQSPVGDDVFRDDPTVRQFEEECAALLGKEAALFVPSGTMANNIGIAVHTRPGDEIILMEDAHTYLYEAGGTSRLWGVHPRPLVGQAGCLSPEQIERAIRPDDPHCPRTSLVLLENTHNVQGGLVVAPERLAAVSEVCQQRNLRLHLDGARLFNAVVASGREAREFTRHVDTVSVCFSKGLSCPVGSVLAGTETVMTEALRLRKLLGGGMRQAGVLAACGRVALAEGIARLAEDHRRAARIGSELGALPGVRVHPDPPQTNIVILALEDDPQGARLEALDRGLRVQGVGAVPLGIGLRMVTHRNLDDSAVDHAIDSFKRVYGQV